MQGKAKYSSYVSEVIVRYSLLWLHDPKMIVTMYIVCFSCLIC